MVRFELKSVFFFHLCISCLIDVIFRFFFFFYTNGEFFFFVNELSDDRYILDSDNVSHLFM